MAEFKSYRSFRDFSISVTQGWRYTRNPEQEEFLAAVLETSKSRTEEISKGKLLWRAQIGHSSQPSEIEGEPDEEFCPFPPERMKPLKSQASEGRANPKGIPYLYLATEPDTAVAEVRPWVGVLVSVAQFIVTRPLTIVNCSMDEKRLIAYATEPDATERQKSVWRDINYAFSRPITQNEQVADYVPTQVLAEMFRHHESDGIAYKSSLGSGTNIVLFDFEAAEVINCALSLVDAVYFSVNQVRKYFLIRKQAEFLKTDV